MGHRDGSPDPLSNKKRDGSWIHFKHIFEEGILQECSSLHSSSNTLETEG